MISFYKKWCLVVFLSVSSTTVFAEESAIDLLNRMSKALHQLSYNGTLVLVQGKNISSLLIEHSVINGVESERIVRLNEQGSEVSKEIIGFSLSKIPHIRPEMEKIYSFDVGRENRVANIPCRIITARPKDKERYLLKYCIDMVSGMLLDYRLVGKTHKPVEQFMFTNIDIKIPESVDDNSLVPVQGRDLQSGVNGLLQQVSSASLDDGWVVGSLPAGFEIRQAPHLKETLPNEKEEQTTKHYVITDGLISMSLFLTPVSSTIKPQDSIQIRSGALNMISQDKYGYRITAVGEVPELTLKNLVKNLRKE